MEYIGGQVANEVASHDSTKDGPLLHGGIVPRLLCYLLLYIYIDS